MTVSFGMLGILLMLDICFIVNYFLVRALRRWTNSKIVQEKKRHKSTKAAPRTSSVSNKEDFLGDVAFAWLVGSVKLEAMSVKKFPGWKPIPYNMGILSTSLFVVLSCLLLAPDLLAKQVLGVAPNAALQLDADLCVAESFEAGLHELQEDLWNRTNLPLAQQQHKMITTFHEALVNDTALYGVPPYQCASRGAVSGLKEDWNRASKQNDFSSVGPFFPGYCEEALEEALQVAQDRQCYHEVCDCPTLPDTAVFQMVGLADKKFCGEVCVQVPHACPPHADEDLEERKERLSLLADVRYQQLEAAEARRIEMAQNGTGSQQQFLFDKDAIPDNVQSSATQTADKVLHQVDIASYIYIAYSCISLMFPSPLILFRMPYWISIKRFLFGVQKPYFICFVLCVWWGIEFLRQVYYSPDFWLFLNNLRLGDPCFVDADYLMERQKIFNEVCQELAPLEPEFDESVMTITDVLRGVDFFSDSCNCAFPNQYTSRLMSNEYTRSAVNNSVLASVISNLTTMAAIGFNQTMEFCNGNDGESCNEILVPGDNIAFLGNSSICSNFTESRRLVWESTMDADAQTDHWYELWLASGFLATLMIKFAVANFGLSLMELADPFVVCAGEFLWMAPPASMEGSRSRGSSSNYANTSTRQMLEAFDEQGRALPNKMVQTWFKTKQRSLVHVGFSKTLFWGIIVHLCMINLFLSVYQEVSATINQAIFVGAEIPSYYEMLEENDRLVLAYSLGCAAVVSVLGIYFVCRLNRLASIQEEHLGDTDDSSSESDGENQRGTTGRSPDDDCVTMSKMMAGGDIGERELMEGIVVQLDTEDRCTSPILVG